MTDAEVAEYVERVREREEKLEPMRRWAELPKRVAHAADLGLEVPDGFFHMLYVWEGPWDETDGAWHWEKAEGSGRVVIVRHPPRVRFRLEVVTAFDKRGVRPEVTAGDNPAAPPGLEHLRRDVRLLRVRVSLLSRPALCWTWQAGRVVLEGVEGASGKAVKEALPGLALLRRVVAKAGPGRPAAATVARAALEDAAQAADLRRLHAAGRTWKEAAAEVGVSLATAKRRREDYPP